MDRQYTLGNGGTAQTHRVFIENITNHTIGHNVLESTSILNGQGQGGNSQSMTAGFIVSSEGRLIVDTFPGGGKISDVVIRGYLTTDR